MHSTPPGYQHYYIPAEESTGSTVALADVLQCDMPAMICVHYALRHFFTLQSPNFTRQKNMQVALYRRCIAIGHASPTSKLNPTDLDVFQPWKYFNGECPNPNLSARADTLKQ